MPRKKVSEEAVETTVAVADEPAEKKRRGRKPAVKKDEPETAAEQAAVEQVAEPAEAPKKRTAAKKPEPKEAEKKPEVSAVIQCSAGQVSVKDVTDAAVEAYKAAHEGAEIETVTIYIKPEENAVYYVVNGDDSAGNNKIPLI